ncbi:MAG: galactokinase [Acidobacteriota bacterium]|nr:galactokinase [Acidobacteriota bacterium]
MAGLDSLRQEFRRLFGAEPRAFRAPGRVNLIGGHTDYNEGWVLPLAIDRDCLVLATARSDRRLRVHSREFGETIEAGLDGPAAGEHHWSRYVFGVAWALGGIGVPVAGADLLVASDVPHGGGLSSSAALEVSTAFALSGLASVSPDRAKIARACQRAENGFVGMRCGIMDQLASCFGRRDHALLIDCRTLDVRPVPLDSSRVRVVVANTMARHALAGSAYNRRREECEEAVRRIAAVRPGIRALRDASWEKIASLAQDWPESIRHRARHVTLEIARVHAAAKALESGDYEALGTLMLESHRSLHEDYEVSSAELNLMVELARELPGALGARMTGGGFGGSTVNLVRAEAVDDFTASLAHLYESRTGIVPQITACRPGDGAGEIV